MNDYFQTIAAQETELKYVVMELNTFVNFTRKIEPDVNQILPKK